MLDQENICLSVEKTQREYKSVAPEIVQTSSFQFDDFQHYVDVNMNKKSAYTYTRGENPTLTILEEKLAQLEKGECAKVFASGMGAISATILSLVQQKDHIVIVNTVYGSTVKFIILNVLVLKVQKLMYLLLKIYLLLLRTIQE